MVRGLLYSAEHLAQGMFVPHVVLSRTQTVGDIQLMEFSSHLYRYIYIVLLFLLCFRVHAHLYSHTHLKAQSHPIRCILHVFPHTCASPTQWSLPTRLCTIHRSIPRNVVVAFFCEYANISIENGYQPVTQPTTFILLSGVNWALTRAAPNPHVSRPRLAFSWHSYIHHTHQWTPKNRFFFDARPFLYQCTLTSFLGVLISSNYIVIRKESSQKAHKPSQAVTRHGVQWRLLLIQIVTIRHKHFQAVTSRHDSQLGSDCNLMILTIYQQTTRGSGHFGPLGSFGNPPPKNTSPIRSAR